MISEFKKEPTGRTSKHLEEVLPWLLIFGMGVAWGLSFSLTKIAVNYSVTPMGVTVWQSILIGIVSHGHIGYDQKEAIAGTEISRTLCVHCG